MELQTFRLRTATAADAELIGWQRARMFHDMGRVPEELFEDFATKGLDRLRAALADEAYLGWFVTDPDQPDRAIAGAGLILRDVPSFPRPDRHDKIRIADGRQGLIVNVYTEAKWRRHGLARLLMETILVTARERQLDSLILHAAEQARPLYEKLGFVSTNEMRYGEDLL